MRTARVPASSANLGPGFDTLGLALGLYVEVAVEEAPHLSVDATGEGSELAADPGTHLAVRVVRRVLGHDRVRIRVHSDIPVSRGLGSSASLAAAAAAAAGAEDPLAVAAEVDGHPENAAASIVGGLVTATTVDGVAVVNRLPLDPRIEVVVVIPDRELPTKEARAALPAAVPFEDATHNLGRMGLLLAGLADHTRLVPAAADDRLHQRQRSPLFPESVPIVAGLVDAGASMACWSGAGPTLLALCGPGRAGDVASAAEALLGSERVDGTVRRLQVDSVGLVVSG